MAFCAKCGTPLNEAGVCPSCGYVLPQDKRPAQAGSAAGSESNGEMKGSVEPQADPVQGTVQGQPANNGSQGQPYYEMPQNGAPAGGQQQPYYNNNTASGYGGAYGQGSQMGYGAGQNGYNGGQNGYNPQGGPAQGPQMGPNGPYYNQGSGPQGQPYYGQMPRRQSSELGDNIIQWFLGIFQKDPVAVFEKAGNSNSPVWAIYMAIYAFFGALAIAFSVGSVVGMLGEIIDFDLLEAIFDRASIQSAVISFVAGLLFYASTMFLTALAVWLLMMILGKKIPYWNACNVTMVAYIPATLAIVFSFICSFTVVTSLIATFVSSVASIATMILLYCGINRLCGDEKSALWPYVIAQAALKVLTTIVAVIFIFICVVILSTMIAAVYNVR